MVSLKQDDSSTLCCRVPAGLRGSVWRYNGIALVIHQGSDIPAHFLGLATFSETPCSLLVLAADCIWLRMDDPVLKTCIGEWKVVELRAQIVDHSTIFHQRSLDADVALTISRPTYPIRYPAANIAAITNACLYHPDVLLARLALLELLCTLELLPTLIAVLALDATPCTLGRIFED